MTAETTYKNVGITEMPAFNTNRNNACHLKGTSSCSMCPGREI